MRRWGDEENKEKNSKEGTTLYLWPTALSSHLPRSAQWPTCIFYYYQTRACSSLRTFSPRHHSDSTGQRIRACWCCRKGRVIKKGKINEWLRKKRGRRWLERSSEKAEVKTTRAKTTQTTDDSLFAINSDTHLSLYLSTRWQPYFWALFTNS